MPEVIDWPRAPDPDAAIRAAADGLRAGRVVVLPTEAGYVLAASAESAAAFDRMCQLSAARTDPMLSLALSAEVVARTWAPRLKPLGRRLVRRLWPGPVTLTFSDPVLDLLPGSVAARVGPSTALFFRSPSHEVVREVLQLLPDSVLLADVAPLTGVQLAETLGERVDLILDDGPVRFPEGPTVVRVAEAGWQVLRVGAVPADLVERQTVCLVVFVCTGNTCRSPMAEALCKKRLSDRLGCHPEELPRRGYLVISAGLSAYNGGPAATEALASAAAYGADLAGHHSRGMTAELLLQADYVVGMTRDHVKALAAASAGLTTPPRLLSPAGDDLPDPVGHDRAVYEECAAAIWQHVDALTAEILTESPPRSVEPIK